LVEEVLEPDPEGRRGQRDSHFSLNIGRERSQVCRVGEIEFCLRNVRTQQL
jgi:hypothetical protein